jgi:hypothetical protein
MGCGGTLDSPFSLVFVPFTAALFLPDTVKYISTNAPKEGRGIEGAG